MNKLIVLDCDGCLCPASKGFNNNAKVFMKYFHDADRTFIALFKERGDTVVMLSGDTNINKSYAQYCDIDFYCSRKDDGTLDKLSFFERFQEIYSVKPEDMVFAGDDCVADLPLMKKIIYNGGIAFCPMDAHIKDPHVKRLFTNGGHGIVSEIYEWFYPGNYEIKCLR